VDKRWDGLFKGGDDDGDDDKGSSRQKGPSCKGKHGLKKYAAPNDAIKCDACGSRVSKGGDFYGCKPCGETLCLGCFGAGGGELEREANCPGSHGLRPSKVATDGYACVGCATLMPRGTPTKACKECNFQLCIVCFEVPPDHVSTSAKGSGDGNKPKVYKHGALLLLCCCCCCFLVLCLFMDPYCTGRLTTLH